MNFWTPCASSVDVAVLVRSEGKSKEKGETWNWGSPRVFGVSRGRSQGGLLMETSFNNREITVKVGRIGKSLRMLQKLGGPNTQSPEILPLERLGSIANLVVEDGCTDSEMVR